ncbi:MAG: hypothetical protein U0P46_11905 [Holophagaceae bacterium]
MFDLANWRSPETLMLNITNGILGIATIVLIVWICGSAIYEHRALHHKTNTKH